LDIIGQGTDYIHSWVTTHQERKWSHESLPLCNFVNHYFETRTKITFAGTVLSGPSQTSHLGNINLNLQHKEFIWTSAECGWSSSNDSALCRQFMRHKVPSSDYKTILAWQNCLGFRLLRAKAVPVANFPSDVLTNSAIWFPLRAAVLGPVAKAEWAASPLDILMRSAQVSP